MHCNWSACTMVGWLVGWLVGCLVGYLVDCWLVIGLYVLWFLELLFAWWDDRLFGQMFGLSSGWLIA